MKTKLRKFAGLLSARFREPSVCAACGAEFSCGASLRGCWCSEIKLDEATRAELGSRYRGCLCRECLERLAVDNAV
ncbi:MAG: hypothetical protein DMF71_18340 [Acidobacteria bacterium]|nr:MAG: hypothetical protein DMF71_18340 [Acidobacteriota bacterium]